MTNISAFTLTRLLRCAPLQIAFLCILGLFAGCKPERDTSTTEQINNSSTRNPVPKQAASLLVEAKGALKKGQFRRALTLADSAQQIAPENADLSPLYFFQGRVFSQLRQYKYAKQSFEKAVEIRPEYRGGWYQLGNLDFRRSKYRDALNYYQNERKYQGNHPRILYQIGRCYTHLGKRDSAHHAFRQTIAGDSTFARAYLELSKLDEERGDYKEDLQNAKQALELQSNNVDFQYQYGSLLFQMGRVKESLPILRRVVAEDSLNRGANYYLGQALVREGQTEEGQKYLERAERLRKQNKRIEQLEAEAEIYSHQVDRWTKLGRALRRAGRTEEAVEAYTIARTLKPQNQAIRDTLRQLRRR